MLDTIYILNYSFTKYYAPFVLASINMRNKVVKSVFKLGCLHIEAKVGFLVTRRMTWHMTWEEQYSQVGVSQDINSGKVGGSYVIEKITKMEKPPKLYHKLVAP